MTLFTPSLQWIGGLICVFILGHVMLLVLSALRRMAFDRRRQALSLQLLQTQIDSAKRLQLKREEAALGWNGYRKFTIQRKVRECDDVSSFYLVAHDKKPIPGFLPGQYLTFRVDLPGHRKDLVRCYSLSDRPRPDCYRVTIKRLAPPRDRPAGPGGLVSSYFHQQLKEGDIVDVKAPSGHFALDTAKTTPVVLIAAGVGVTPILSMLNEIVESGSKRETWVFFGVRNSSDHIMRDHLLAVAAAADHVRLRIFYSRAPASHQEGNEFIYRGRVTIDALKNALPSNNYSFYLCGPGAMMNDMTRGLREWGVPDRQIFFEAFGPASVKVTPPSSGTVAPTPPAFKITFARSGKETTWDGESVSLLEFAEARHVVMNSGCRAGNCGTCLTALKSGEVAYLQESGARPEPGSCLTCVCIPKSDLVVDA